MIQFLYESSLIGKLVGQELLEPILDLSFADLRGLDFEYGNLDGICLPKTNLRNSNFHSAKLICANFYNADLDDSNLMDKLVKQRTNSSIAIAIQKRVFAGTRIQLVQETIC